MPSVLTCRHGMFYFRTKKTRKKTNSLKWKETGKKMEVKKDTASKSGTEKKNQ